MRVGTWGRHHVWGPCQLHDGGDEDTHLLIRVAQAASAPEAAAAVRTFLLGLDLAQLEDVQKVTPPHDRRLVSRERTGEGGRAWSPPRPRSGLRARTPIDLDVLLASLPIFVISYVL